MIFFKGVVMGMKVLIHSHLNGRDGVLLKGGSKVAPNCAWSRVHL